MTNWLMCERRQKPLFLVERRNNTQLYINTAHVILFSDIKLSKIIHYNLKNCIPITLQGAGSELS